MYDDLARTQNPSTLEWFVMHAMIPSVLLTLALQSHPVTADSPKTRPDTYVDFGYLLPMIEERWSGSCRPIRAGSPAFNCDTANDQFAFYGASATRRFHTLGLTPKERALRELISK